MFEAGGDGLSKALRSVGVGSWHRGPSAKTIPFFPRWSAQASMELQELSEREERGGEVHHVQGATSSFYLRDPEPWHSVCLAVYLSPSFFYFLLPFSLSLSVCQLSAPSVWFLHDKNLFFKADKRGQADDCL